MEKKTVVIGICGGIAAYKTAQLASNLYKKGYDVHVIMTKNATEFITPMTFETLTHNRVSVGTFDRNFQYDVNHVSLAKRADVFVLAPASANCIAKIAHGIADDMLTTTFLAANCPKLIAPAMNTGMLNNPITQRNIQQCREFGMTIIESASGYLACGDVGKGRLAEIEDIEDAIECLLIKDKPLAGIKVVVTAGPTQEDIDPVRFITNHSSGKMGYALARAARNLGAEVTLITGPTSLRKPVFMTIIEVRTADEMFQEVSGLKDQYDILIKSAAVSDYRASFVNPHKLKKQSQQTTLDLVMNKDILLAMGKEKKDSQVICGFAMETENLEENATKKLLGKNADLIVANQLNEEFAGFKGDTNVVTLIQRDGIVKLNKMSKEALGYEIMEQLLKILIKKRGTIC
ncbi:bifunctional phosphopantothenoylcysteine decarboxylase/phosphopantothenate--cysteine ligase CoaBC [Turicibacter sp. 1E2]|uniref:bifunctional phosphopantothenoylcysteine decarboxylase/phosphopantothenate--cysteine ligase CoaBC n=1 Tax=Turicibacter sp. 1E2 TaxID=2951143 RepID=UPI0021D4F545|nr:bifunctional phosphopantothenoylcysteine decarboxylase/phosphopantothenate--cysteine ligase CoaBC [Turicibacter sp. 1E2]MCU7210133.1 bifunctional phosphopantothenoylcysteine decarboxylase/phosphopantothenate--cysteine ligase CoaBC [Turicibacter sp. 1E2]